MSNYVVIGTSPFVETSVTVGPFRSIDKAMAASSELEYRGYVSEISLLQNVLDLETLAGATEDQD